MSKVKDWMERHPDKEWPLTEEEKQQRSEPNETDDDSDEVVRDWQDSADRWEDNCRLDHD